jgi:hypothetical protein
MDQSVNNIPWSHLFASIKKGTGWRGGATEENICAHLNSFYNQTPHEKGEEMGFFID